jgi:hypothetical protein
VVLSQGGGESGENAIASVGTVIARHICST